MGDRCNVLFNLYCTLYPTLRPVTHLPCSHHHDGGQYKPCSTGWWVLAMSSLPNIWDAPEGESDMNKLGRAEVSSLPQACVLGVCWATLVTWAAGSEIGTCQMAPFQVVHESDPAAWGHWAAASCGNGRAGFAFYVQSVHLLVDNKTPSSHGPSPCLLLLLCCTDLLHHLRRAWGPPQPLQRHRGASTGMPS